MCWPAVSAVPQSGRGGRFRVLSVYRALLPQREASRLHLGVAAVVH